MRVAEHQVLAGQAHRLAAHALVAAEGGARAARGASPKDGQPVVVLADRELAPGGEIVEIAGLVEGLGRAAEEEQEGPARRGDLDGLEEAIDDEDRELERVALAADARGGLDGVEVTLFRERGRCEWVVWIVEIVRVGGGRARRGASPWGRSSASRRVRLRRAPHLLRADRAALLIRNPSTRGECSNGSDPFARLLRRAREGVLSLSR